MATNNNKLTGDANSYSVFKNMGYTQQNATNVRNASDNFTSVDAQNIVIKVDEPDIKLNVQVPYFSADLYDKTPNDPLDFKDFKSFDVGLKRGLVTIGDKDLSYTATKAAADATKNVIRNIDINFAPGNVIDAKIKVKKFITLNLDVEGQAHANPVNNMVRFTPDKIKLNGVSIKGLLDFFHIQVGEVVKVHNSKGSLFTSGDSIYFNPTKFLKAPHIEGGITSIATDQGTITVGVGGEDPNNKAKIKLAASSENYLALRGGNVNFSGFNLLHTDLKLIDGTPQDPFDIINDPSKKVITQGQVTIPQEFIATALKQKMGAGSSMKDMSFSMPNGQGKLKASMWGFLPISLDLNFGKASTGELKVTPGNGKAFGFIPLPNSILRSTLLKETDGKIDGQGVTIDLDKLADLKTSPLQSVTTEQGKLILKM